MTVYDLTYNIANAIHNDEELQAFAIDKFGAELKIFIDSVGTLDHIDIVDDYYDDAHRVTAINNAIYPHIVISGISEDGGVIADGEEYEVAATLVINASQSEDGTDIDSSKSIRDRNGIYVFARGSDLSTFSTLLKNKVRRFKVGAIYQTESVVYDSDSQYPVQYSVFSFKYKSYKSFPKTF